MYGGMASVCWIIYHDWHTLITMSSDNLYNKLMLDVVDKSQHIFPKVKTAF